MENGKPRTGNGEPVNEKKNDVGRCSVPNSRFPVLHLLRFDSSAVEGSGA